VTTTPLLQLQGVSVRRDGRPLLEVVSFDVSPGEFVAVVGPNGAGKSTLLRAVTGEWPSLGQVRFAGRPRTVGRVHRPTAVSSTPCWPR
jgi:ABC-type molybdenum transport system ATPase subunit/photorepair protein PhrA